MYEAKGMPKKELKKCIIYQFVIFEVEKRMKTVIYYGLFILNHEVILGHIPLFFF